MLAFRLSPAVAVCACVLLAPLSSAQAQSEVFLCPGANGVPEYKNNGNTKGCRKLSLQEPVSIPAPRQPAARSQEAAPAVSPAGGAFPRIDTATQRTRDSERRGVLERELGDEEGKLAALRREYNGGEPERLGNERNYQKYLDRVASLKEDIARSEANIAAIRRELSALR
jgi:hypothetical protein